MHPSLNLLQTARLAFCGLFALAAAGSATAQTGVGLVLSSAATHTFPETTVGTTTTFTVTLTNSVAAAQTAYFGGLAAPFSLTSSAPIAIPGSGTTTLTLQFSPTATGTFTDTLTVVGNIFGSASLILTGTGIEVDLDYASTALAFPATALGATSTTTVAVHNVGDGTALLSAPVFSHPAFSLVTESSTLSIAEGESGTLTFSFAPTAAGNYSETVTIASNDPNEPSVTLTLSATAVSEVSGEVCNTTWTLANSPYTLVGNVTVPAGCTLTIEPGVVVNGDENIIVFGNLLCNGSTGNDVIMDGPTIIGKPGATLDLEHLVNLSIGSIALPGFETQLPDVYHEDFESYTTGNHPFTCFNRDCCGTYHIGSNGNGSGCETTQITTDATNAHSGSKSFQWFSNTYYADLFLTHPIVAPATGWYYLSFGYKTTQQEYEHRMLAYYSKNGQAPCTSCYGDSWVNFYESAWEDNSSLEDRIVGTYIYLNAGERINLRIEHGMRNDGWGCANEQRSWIDDIRLTLVSGSEADYVLYTNNFDTNLGSNENTILNSLGWSGYNSNQFANSNTFLDHPGNHLRFRVYYNEDWIRTQEFIAPVSGYYTIRYNEHIAGRGQYSVPAMNARIGSGEWFNIYERTVRTCSSYLEWYNGWRWRTHTIGYVEAGQTFQIEFNPNISSPDLDWYIDDVSIQRLPWGTMPLSVSESVTWRGVHLDVPGIYAGTTASELQNLTATFLVIEAPTGSQSIVNGTFEHCSISAGSISLENVQVSEGATFDANGGEAEVEQSVFEGGVTVRDGDYRFENTRIQDAPYAGLKAEQSAIVELDYCTVAGNEGAGLDLGTGFHEVTNSIIYGNNPNGNYAQVIGANTNNAVLYASHSLISGYGSFGTPDNDATNAPNFFWGDGMLGSNPLFADAELHLQPWSPAVDAAMPWHTDAHMPFGLGGLRADMGAYGGPGNAGWGGQAAPSGAAVLAAVLDSPQDQGGHVGLTFGASAFDEAWVPENVTHYAVWRHFDPSGTAIADVEDGNWELLGSMPSLGLNGYAFSAATLGNTNAYGEFESCYFVAAHTADPGTYWVSNVVCGESVDNLAPEDPVVNGLVLPSGGVEVQWEAPTDEDYAYTLISSDQGFSATVGSDTLVVDVAALGGGVYTVRHVDVNGNESAPGVWVAGASSGVDIIPLRAGWNLISTDRVPETATPAAFFGGLEPGNLQYVTGFNGGVQYFNPSGLSFLNTLSAVAPGYGYWVRVAAADTLYVAGSALPAGYLPTLDAGWNLVGYTAAAPQAPADFFSDFVADGTLEYVTGFDAGATFFDPDGLPFLNTLSQLRNGFGYWVRLTSGTNGLATDGSPAYDLVNGRSALGAFAGDRVEVVTAEGEVVAHLPILQGGYLMTAAVFGDDPATDRVEGVAPGTVLGFRFQGRVAAETVIAGGEMGLREVELTFPDGAEGPLGAGVYPNPTDGPVRFRADLGAGVVSWTVADLAGRTVADGVSGAHAGGAWESGFDASGLAPGLYTWTVRVDGVPAATLPWLRAE